MDEYPYFKPNKFSRYAHIIRMGIFFLCLCAIIIAVFILFLPFYLEVNVHADLKRKKLVFGVYLNKIVKIVSGYTTTYYGGIALHLTEKKAVLIPYSGLEKERKKFSFTRTFKFVSFRIVTKTGAEYMFPVAVAHSALIVGFRILGISDEKDRSEIWLMNGDGLIVSARLKTRFTIRVLLVALFKWLKEKLKEKWKDKKKKSTIS